jgi:hypothetical protein
MNEVESIGSDSGHTSKEPPEPQPTEDPKPSWARRAGRFAAQQKPRFLFLIVLIVLLLLFNFLSSLVEDLPSALRPLLFSGALTLALALWWLPRLQVAHSQGVTAENRFDRENEARKTLAQIVGGLLLLGGLYSSIKTFTLQRETENLQREGQITDRFTKAIDQLGALTPGGGVGVNGRPKINLEVRLGGIYALERIAIDSPKDHWTIMEILSAYLRENSLPPELHLLRRDEPIQYETGTVRLPADIQAAITVIGRRGSQNEPILSALDLSSAYLAGANLLNANLKGAYLAGTNLNSAILVAADLEGAYLEKAQLRETNLSAANLSGADLLHADLRGAKLDRADLGSDLMDAHLEGVDLSSTSLKGANLHYAHLEGTNLSTHLEGVDLRQAYIEGADLSAAVGLDPTMLASAFGDKETKLPPGIARPDSWKLVRP